MNFVSVFMAVFALLGAADLLAGNRFGLGQEFKRGFSLLGQMALSMIGMIVLAPSLSKLLAPILVPLSANSLLEPSVFPAMLLANDMGCAPLADALAAQVSLGRFNGLVVSSMMGCTVSFTIPVALNMVEPQKRSPVLLGLLCGIVTIPAGCILAGLMLGFTLIDLFFDLLPLLVFSFLIALGLKFFPRGCMRVFSLLGKGIQALALIGLMLGLLRSMTGLEILPGLDTYESGARICFNAAAVMSGAFPFLLLLKKLLARPMRALGKRLRISESSAFGFLSSLATSLTTFESFRDMDSRGIVLNSAFCVSAGYTFAAHLAFTLSYDEKFVLPVIVGKLFAGLCALWVALLVTRKQESLHC